LLCRPTLKREEEEVEEEDPEEERRTFSFLPAEPKALFQVRFLVEEERAAAAVAAGSLL